MAPAFPWRVALALGIVYVVWGSTYLAIRVAVEGLPPFLMAGGRWLLASLILLVAALATRQARPTWAQVAWAGVVGMFLLIGGNGLVVWAAQFISSGMAALLVASLPLWTLVLESIAPGGARPTRLGVAGVGLGLVGVGVLLFPSLSTGLDTALWAQALVLFGALLWAIGTLIGRRVGLPASGLYNSAFQMLFAALGFVVLSLAFGEPARVRWEAVPASAWIATGYLVVFGSCVAFSSYAWLVKHAKPDLVSTYAYVNPAVAVLLGTWLLSEPLTGWTLAGALLIVVSVALVMRGGRPAPVERPVTVAAPGVEVERSPSGR